MRLEQRVNCGSHVGTWGELGFKGQVRACWAEERLLASTSSRLDILGPHHILHINMRHSIKYGLLASSPEPNIWPMKRLLTSVMNCSGYMMKEGMKSGENEHIHSRAREEKSYEKGARDKNGGKVESYVTDSLESTVRP